MKNSTLQSKYIEEKTAFDERVERMEAIDEILGKDDLSVKDAINALLQARKFGWDTTQMWEQVLGGIGLSVHSATSTDRGMVVRLKYEGFAVLLITYSNGSCDSYVILDDVPVICWYDSAKAMDKQAAAIQETAQRLKEKYIDCEMSYFEIASTKGYHHDLFSVMRSEWYKMAPDCHVKSKMLRSKKKRVEIVQEVIDNIMSRVDPLVSRAEKLTAVVKELEVQLKALWPQIKDVLNSLEGTPYSSPEYGVRPENVADKNLNKGFAIEEKHVYSELIGSLYILNKPVNAIIESMAE